MLSTLTWRMICRGNSTSVATARSSDSRTAKPNHSSFSERTHGGLHGQHYIGGSIRRALVRYDIASDGAHGSCLAGEEDDGGNPGAPKRRPCGMQDMQRKTC